MVINLMMWKIYLLKMSWMNFGYLKQTSMHEIYFVSHLAVHIDREQTSLFFGEVLCASQKNKKKQKQRKKNWPLRVTRALGVMRLKIWAPAPHQHQFCGCWFFLDSCDRLHINHSKNGAKNVRISYIYEITWLELLKLTSRKLRSFE